MSHLTTLRDTRYLGSHPAVRRRHGGIDIEFTSEAVVLRQGRRDLGVLPWSRITELRAETAEGVDSGIRIARVAVLGWLGLLMRRERWLAYLAIVDADGTWRFEVPDLRSKELEKGIEPLRQFVGGG